jgi:glycosyltransferase involved in cell wall biosynthesis
MVIIPAYNEALSLPPLLAELRSRYPGFDVLVVNDGSRDHTASVVTGSGARLVSLACNLGAGGAVQTGLLAALEEDYDIAIQVDGDGQHPPGEISKLLDAMRQSGADMALGSRFLAEGGYRSTAGRRFAIRCFSWAVSAMAGTRITDATSGFRAWNRRAIAVLANDYPEDYPEVEAILRLHQAGLRIVEVPVQMAERSAGRSSIGTWEAITYMVKVPLALLMNLLRG